MNKVNKNIIYFNIILKLVLIYILKHLILTENALVEMEKFITKKFFDMYAVFYYISYKILILSIKYSFFFKYFNYKQ